MMRSLKHITANLPSEIPNGQGALVSHNFRSITVDLTCRFSHTELAKLCRMIEAALPDKPCRVVQFVSSYTEEGASEIALETAIIAARLIGHRVLFIDTTAAMAKKRRRKFSGMPTATLETSLLAGLPPYEAIAQAAGTELYFAMLCQPQGAEDGLAPISLNTIEVALESLRLYFDLIIVDSQAILTDAFGMALAKLVDGSVMIIEAERTRAPVAAECKRLIESSGGRLLGAAMNRRRLYIPDYLYRLLYQRVAI